jgi:hypothetical protein
MLQILAHLRKMKKIRPCKVLKKFGANGNEIELPDGIEISPIFNISDLYRYKVEEAGTENEQPVIQWKKQMPVAEKPQMERILDKRVSKKTRQNQYFEYLVKWKDHPVEDVSWENEAEIQRHGQIVRYLMDRSP